MTGGSLVVRMSYDKRTRDYVARRTAEGKTTPEIMRCLKRYLARKIYQALPPTAPVDGGSITHRFVVGLVYLLSGGRFRWRWELDAVPSRDFNKSRNVGLAWLGQAVGGGGPGADLGHETVEA